MQTHCPWFYHFRSIYQLFKNGVCSWCLTIVYFHVSITSSVYMKIKSLLQSKMHTPFLKGILRLLVWFSNMGTGIRSTGEEFFHTCQIFDTAKSGLHSVYARNDKKNITSLK